MKLEELTYELNLLRCLLCLHIPPLSNFLSEMTLMAQAFVSSFPKLVQAYSSVELKSLSIGAKANLLGLLGHVVNVLRIGWFD